LIIFPFGFDEPLLRAGLAVRSWLPDESNITNESDGSVRRRNNDSSSLFILCSCYVLISGVDIGDARRIEPRPRRDPQPDADAFQPPRTGGRGRLARPGRGARRSAETADDGHHRASQVDPDPQQLARRGLRPIDKCVPRVRTRLHLLLRATDPRLSRPLAWRGFRIAAVREAECRAAAARRSVAPRLRMPADRDG